ncbi:MAG: Kelch repeat-containing protein, partial [Limisphaerales bacterium]
MNTKCLPLTPRLLAAGLLALLALPLRAIEPDLPFSSGSTGADGPLTFREIIPSGRSFGAMAYDAARNRIVLFGGNTGTQNDDTWLFDGTNWTRVLPATRPPSRWAHSMVYDAARQEVILFGGQRDGGIRYGDTWAWNGSNWVQKVTAEAPSARFYAPMAYDSARQRVVLYGGSHDIQETWEWDGVTWIKRTPAATPGNQSNCAMAYDAARQRTIHFGNFGQTWAWDGTNWANLNPVDPPQARNYSAMAYDPVRQEIIMVSGSNLADTWAWSGTQWTRRTPVRQISGRQGGLLVWHAGLQRLASFGGDISGVDGYSADLDLWDGTNWTYFSGKSQTFDMSGRANGTWNFSSIRVPPGVTVVFNRNAGNTPVRWLATNDVVIDGALSLNGGFGANSLPPGEVAQGGPGGYSGGR